MTLSLESALESLAQVKHPELGGGLVEHNLVKDVRVDPAGKVALTLVLTSAVTAQKEQLVTEVTRALTQAGASGVEIKTEVRVIARDITSEDPIPEVKNIVLVMSGKGGVGKSTVAANLTMSLHRAGLRVATARRMPRQPEVLWCGQCA